MESVRDNKRVQMKGVYGGKTDEKRWKRERWGAEVEVGRGGGGVGSYAI